MWPCLMAQRLTLGPGDAIISLDHVPVRSSGSKLELHIGMTSIDFVQHGSDDVQHGTIDIGTEGRPHTW